MKNEIKVMEFSAPLAIIPMDTAMEFHHTLTAGSLVKAINILRDNGCKLSCGLPLGQLFVGCIRLRIGGQHFRAVEAEKLFGVAFVKCMA